MPTKPYDKKYVATGNTYIHLVPTAQIPTTAVLDTASMWKLINHPTHGHLTLDTATYSGAILAGFTDNDVEFAPETTKQDFKCNEFKNKFLSIVEDIMAKVSFMTRSRWHPIWGQLTRGVGYARKTDVLSGSTIDFVYGDADVEPADYGVVCVSYNRGNKVVSWVPKITLPNDPPDKWKRGGMVEGQLVLEGEFIETHPYPYSKCIWYSSAPDA